MQMLLTAVGPSASPPHQVAPNWMSEAERREPTIDKKGGGEVKRGGEEESRHVTRWCRDLVTRRRLHKREARVCRRSVYLAASSATPRSHRRVHDALRTLLEEQAEE